MFLTSRAPTLSLHHTCPFLTKSRKVAEMAEARQRAEYNSIPQANRAKAMGAWVREALNISKNLLRSKTKVNKHNSAFKLMLHLSHLLKFVIIISDLDSKELSQKLYC